MTPARSLKFSECSGDFLLYGFSYWIGGFRKCSLRAGSLTIDCRIVSTWNANHAIDLIWRSSFFASHIFDRLALIESWNSEIVKLWFMRWHWLRARYEHCSTGIVGHRHGVGHGYRHGHCRTLQVLQHWLLWPASNFFALEWTPAASWIFSPPRFVCQPRFHCLVIIIVVMLMIKTRMSLKTRMNDLPMSFFN